MNGFVLFSKVLYPGNFRAWSKINYLEEGIANY
jgi:hypothetical protein